MADFDYIKKELSKIERGKGSFLGMDGGNIKSNVWICGIEFGSDLKTMERYYQNYVKTYSVTDLDVPYREDCPNYFMNSMYDSFLAALTLCFDTLSVNIDQPEFKEDIDSVLKNELYNKNSSIFKLNLYPLAKKDTSWDKSIEKNLNISKEVYYGKIFSNRIQFIRKLVKKTPNEKVIICTSPKGYENAFVETFFHENQNVKFSYDFLKGRNKSFRISVYDDGLMKVIVIPFLGRGNLGSYEDVVTMGNYLAEKYIDKLPF